MAFQSGQVIIACDVVNLRRSPGHRGKLLEDILGLISAGAMCQVRGESVAADELTWWPIRVRLAGGATAEGWAAEAVNGTTLLAAVAAPDTVDTDSVPGDLPAEDDAILGGQVGSPGGDTGLHRAPANHLGFYLHSTNDDLGLWEAIRRVQPPVMLIHEDAANDILLSQIRDFRAPEALIVGRYYVPNDVQRAMLESGDAEGEGRRFAERILAHDFGKFRKRAGSGRLYFDAWMSLNESIPGPASGTYAEDPAAMKRLYDSYDRFQVEFRRRLVGEGIEAVAFNFAAGNFTEPEHYLDYFPRTLEEYVYLGFHEYGWPSLVPGPSVATSAGVYRRVLEALRVRYGPRHRVVITEAGLTRAYGHPQSPDEGWLNEPDTLDEEAYWSSLAWYNGLLDQDDYVVGACLYQVGHRGDWATFRHMGRDNQGRDLRLIDRLAALKDAGAARGVSVRRADAPARSRRQAATNLRITCVVGSGDKPVAGAEVRLVGDANTLGRVRGAALNLPEAVTWSHHVSGYEGSLRNAWDRFVAGEVAGLTWQHFRRQAVVANPSLADSQYCLHAGQVYLFPENRGAAETVWDRLVTVYEGSVRQAWLDWVNLKVIGLAYDRFRRELAAQNPSLAQPGAALRAAATYVFPRTAGETEYVLTATTNARGRAAIGGIPEGAYRLEVGVEGLADTSGEVALHADRELRVDIQT